MISGPISSIISTRYGHRTTVILGSLLATTGMLISGLAPNIYFLFVSYGVLIGKMIRQKLQPLFI